MAWRSSASTNTGLVQTLKRNGLFKSPRIERAMLAVDRGKFVPHSHDTTPYEDAPQKLGDSGATISAPHMHAIMLDYLKERLVPGARVLDVGSGSGYLTAVMAEMVRGPREQQPSHGSAAAAAAAAAPTDETAAHNETDATSSASAAGPGAASSTDRSVGRVFGVEHIEELVEFSKNAIAQLSPEIQQTCDIRQGDGRAGLPHDAPFDAIHVGAAAPSLPQALVDQLAVGGRMVIPVGQWSQDLLTIDRVSETEFKKRKVDSVMFVPLTDRSYYPKGR